MNSDDRETMLRFQSRLIGKKSSISSEGVSIKRKYCRLTDTVAPETFQCCCQLSKHGLKTVVSDRDDIGNPLKEFLTARMCLTLNGMKIRQK